MLATGVRDSFSSCMNTLRIIAVALIAAFAFLAGCQSTSSGSYGSSADASCPDGSGAACHTIRIREK